MTINVTLLVKAATREHINTGMASCLEGKIFSISLHYQKERGRETERGT